MTHSRVQSAASDRRWVRYFSRSLAKIGTLATESKTFGDSASKEAPTAGFIAGPRDFLERMAASRYSGASRMLTRLMHASMGRWGLPWESARERLWMVAHPGEFSIHRPNLNRSFLDADESFSWQVPRYEVSDVPIFQLIFCSCRQCFRSSICPNEHYLNPASWNCGFCGWSRHDRSVIRRMTKNNRRGEGNRTESITLPSRVVPTSPPRRSGPKGKASQSWATLPLAACEVCGTPGRRHGNRCVKCQKG